MMIYNMIRVLHTYNIVIFICHIFSVYMSFEKFSYYTMLFTDFFSNTIYMLAFMLSSQYIYLGFYVTFKHCTGHITTGSWKGRGNQYIQLVKVLYCKLPINGKQLPAFPLEAVPGTEPRPQRWEARVLPLCHHGPCFQVKE